MTLLRIHRLYFTPVIDTLPASCTESDQLALFSMDKSLENERGLTD
jgi:hypothetical protein